MHRDISKDTLDCGYKWTLQRHLHHSFNDQTSSKVDPSVNRNYSVNFVWQVRVLSHQIASQIFEEL